MIKKIISGGQAGADIAGVDAALACGIPYGGWLPKDRKCETGQVPGHYTEFQVMTRGGYPKRTEQNVIDSDGTVVFSQDSLKGGSELTRRLARKHSKPFLYIDLDVEPGPAGVLSDWIVRHGIEILNVAGSRESKHPGIHDRVLEIIQRVLLNQPIENEIRETVLPWAV